MSDTDMLYMAGLQKRIEALEKENAELKEHKSKSNQLLKAAVKDVGDMSRYCLGVCCDTCPHIRTMDRGYQSCIWQHEKEALALIGDDKKEEELRNDT